MKITRYFSCQFVQSLRGRQSCRAPWCSGMGMWVWPLIGALTALLVPLPSPDGQSPRTRVFFLCTGAKPRAPSALVHLRVVARH